MLRVRSFLSAIAMITLGIGVIGIGTLCPASAQSYPEKPIKLIVPFPPGGPMDTMARLVAHHVSLKFKQTVVVENRGGAGGTLGTAAGAAADPDGYTLLWGSSGTLAIAPALYKSLSFDPKALVPVALVAKLPHALVVPPDVPANTVQELVAYMKANPGKLNFGASLGTPPHLMGALFTAKTGADVTYIPYKGAAPAVSDLLGGRTEFTFDALTILYPLVSAASCGRLPWLMLPAGRRCRTCRPWSKAASPASTCSRSAACWCRPGRPRPSSISSTPRSTRG
jgi:tripartite-type tricarboxylate transporter receptor subunit TctC